MPQPISIPQSALPPCVIHEDGDLLVINKPAGINTHAAGPFAGEGIYDWLRNREPRWGSLAILHRLDKETSGVIIFSKSEQGNRSLHDQFKTREIAKEYVLVTDRPVSREKWTVESRIQRQGDRYGAAGPGGIGDQAITHFTVMERAGAGTVLKAEPETGRTHQIRVHAAESGIPILGDTLYGGMKSHRMHLHAESISFRHPTNGEPVTFRVKPEFDQPTEVALRRGLIGEETSAFRVVHGEAEGWRDMAVDVLGEYWLLQSSQPPGAEALDAIRGLQVAAETAWGLKSRGVLFRQLIAEAGKSKPDDLSPRLISGSQPEGDITVIENGLKFLLRFDEGYSVGLFMDQRDNRRRFMRNHVTPAFPVREGGLAGAEILNTFAYSCAFSVAAAVAGARVTSLDLSKPHLEWGRKNFVANGLDPAAHDFIYGDAFDWMARLGKKGRRYDAVILDPPTFSRTKEGRIFRAERDFPELAELAAKLLKPGGVLFASTNARKLYAELFVDQVVEGVQRAGLLVAERFYAPQGPDYPTGAGHPGHLKTVWLKMDSRA